MNGLDWTLVGIALFCIGRGIMRGAVSQIFGIAGVLGGFLVASHFYESLGVRLIQAFPKLLAPQIIGFALLFILTWFCLGMIGLWFARLLQSTGLGFMDRVWGAGVGFGRAMVFAVILITILTFFLSPKHAFLCQSYLTPYVQEIAQYIVKVTPHGVQNLFERKRQELKRYWLEKEEDTNKPGLPEKKEARVRP